jgi:hypothetical protein
MIESIRWWFSFRRNANFGNWVKDTYSLNELKRLIVEATDVSLINPYNPFGDHSVNQHQKNEELRRTTTRRLMNRYGEEIWGICLGLGGYNPDQGPIGLSCLTKLDLAFQVYNQMTFEEFLIRNALKHAARQILEECEK